MFRSRSQATTKSALTDGVLCSRDHLERLRHGSAKGEERDPVHRRRHVAGASGLRQTTPPKGVAKRARRWASWRWTTCRIWHWWRPPAILSLLISANSASAYATGHKTAVNAMGVYADRTLDPLDRPESRDHHQLGQAAARKWRSASSRILRSQDATPAAMLAHVRRRSEYDRIVEQYVRGQTPTCSWAAAKPIFCRRGADEAPSARTRVDFLARFPRSRLFHRASTADRRKWLPRPPIPARASCSGYLRSAIWTACSIASSSRAATRKSFLSSRT